ncbi:MAG: BlaI/MecI/CopY family transcriptional regulator [Alphaproteobacteria bacterium]|jgi:BlaI family transcriptional regulator, penicillinase repressor|nr:BlaI/MecI/CopY family transcriptional regulator [Alphaproteobacteria bacterium]
MRLPKLSKLELQIMEVLWDKGPTAIRDIQESFGPKGRPAYTTVQTMVYRLEGKKALRRARKIGNAHIFEAVISRDAAKARLVDEFLSLFGGRMQPVMAQLIEAGNLSPKDVSDAEKLLRELAARKKKDA